MATWSPSTLFAGNSTCPARPSTPEIVQTPDLIDRLLRLGYERLGGNRFGRRIEGLPAIEGETPQAIVDVLVPSYTSRPRHNRTFGGHLTTTEVPGLAGARLVKRSRSGLEPVGPHIFIQELDVDVGKADVQSHASIVPVAGVGRQPFHAGPREKGTSAGGTILLNLLPEGCSCRFDEPRPGPSQARRAHPSPTGRAIRNLGHGHLSV